MEEEFFGPKEKDPPKLWIIIGSILLIIIIAGVFTWNHYQNKQIKPQSVGTILNIPTDAPKEAWKLYENTEVGYSIKYPSTWFLYLDKTANKSDLKIQFSKREGDVQTDMTDGLEIRVNNYPDGIVPEEKTLFDSAKTKGQINGYDATKNSQTVAGVTSSNIFIIKDGLLYDIESHYKNETNKTTLTEIVKSFKFTKLSTNSGFINSKIFTQNDLGITFNYPGDWRDIAFYKNSSALTQDSGGSVYTSRGQTNSYNIIEQLTYPDPESAFTFNLYSYDYKDFYMGQLGKTKVDINWTIDDFKKNIITGIFTPLVVQKLGDNALLTIQGTSYECSPLLAVIVYVPIASKDYYNLQMDILPGTEMDQDPILVDYKKTTGSQCDPPYSQIAKNILDGNYPKLKARIETAQKIADSLKNL